VTWEPPESVAREALVEISRRVLDRPDIALTQTEHVFRVNEAGMDWDIGVMIYQPDANHILTGPDGRKVGMFLLHGGSGDYKSLEPLALLLARKFGCRIVSMTYPGRLYLDDASRDWPGDTIGTDGNVRTPIWLTGEHITPDQYVLEKDLSLRARYGTRLVARATPGTVFWNRMAGWPLAFEAAMKQACRDHLPESEYSIYVHGHSTGGPFVHMLTQRVENVMGVVGIENSPFAYIYQKMIGIEWDGPFNDLLIRTWRDIARYKGAEVLSEEGPDALLRLPWLMEEVFEAWEKKTARAQFKAEYPLHYNCVAALSAAAKATAERLELGARETDALIARYVGYGRELTGTGVRPVPPILLITAAHSRDHTRERYEKVVLPMLRAIRPQPKVRVTYFGTGIHAYETPEDGLPMGLAPAAADMWHDAITQGYFVV
jgi:hypothetical protein